MNFLKGLSIRDRLLLAGGILLALVVFGYFWRGVSGFAVDDSFIFFRYAENIANGDGIVFNHGEIPGEGFTSWVWLMLLAAVRWFGFNLLPAAKIFGALFFLLSGVLVYLITARLGTEGEKDNNTKLTGAFLAGLFLLNYRLLAHSVSGMETSLYIFSLLLLVYTVTRAWQADSSDYKWWLRVALCVTFIFLVRPEGLAAGGISLLALAARHKGAVFKVRVWFYVVAGLVVPLVLFLAWKTHYFGYPLPLSFYHKVIGKQAVHRLATAEFFEFLKAYSVVIFPAILLVIHSLFVRKVKLFRYFTILTVVMLMVYLNFLPVMNYLHRFYIPYLPLLLILLSPGIYYLLKAFTASPNPAKRIVLVFLAFFVLVTAMNVEIRQSHGKVVNWKQMTNPAKYRARMGKLMRLLPPGTVVANTEMGVIPYFSTLTCLDMAGLTDPLVAHRGLSMEYLLERNTAIILFPRDVREMPERELLNSPRNYGRVFLSPEFKEQFEYLDFFIAWPDNRNGYHFYINKKSLGYAAIRQWHEENIKEFAGEKRGKGAAQGRD